MKARRTTRLIHEGRFAAEVEVDLLEDDHDWSPYLSLADAQKLDNARLALRCGDLKAASALGKIYELKPIAAE